MTRSVILRAERSPSFFGVNSVEGSSLHAIKQVVETRFLHSALRASVGTTVCPDE